ncbi:ribosome maturation factor RimP [Acidihalobacter ferrooxydans]|uniref:Ribosome maturation factor RimP n=1 Tax=Acidihalobacter ferrooxydans TaxID=1765967 RepID=A0A1P8UJ52_9GAMM|nr:ribosome maturation factor RimP [Acidihalobacter ferrooxydans]APZ43852.1 ribosome maturation factor RimP [Acidihalobacter ferrooxydans]
MSRAASHSELERMIAPVVESFGLALWGLEYTPFGGSALLRVFVDGPQGVTLENCADISAQLSALFDVEDPIPEAYRLEVSSPGLDRVLFKAEQYRLYCGEMLKLRLRWPVDGRRNMIGVLQACDDEAVRVEVDGKAVVVALEAVQRARLVYTGDAPPRRD